MASTGGPQRPWESNGLGRRIYLTERAVGTRGVRRAREWARVDKTSLAELEKFLAGIRKAPKRIMRVGASTASISKSPLRHRARLPTTKIVSAFVPHGKSICWRTLGKRLGCRQGREPCEIDGSSDRGRSNGDLRAARFSQIMRRGQKNWRIA